MTRITRSSTPAARPATRPAGRGAAPARGVAAAAPASPAAPQPQTAAAPRGRTAPAQNVAPSPIANLPTGDRPAAILFLVDELVTVLNRENTAMETRQFSVLQETLESKQALTRGYMELVFTLRKHPELAKEIPDDKRAELRAAGDKLDSVMQRNEVLLRANIDAINSFMGTITTALKESQEAMSPAYSGHGKMDSSNVSARAVAVSLNKEL